MVVKYIIQYDNSTYSKSYLTLRLKHELLIKVQNI